MSIVKRIMIVGGSGAGKTHLGLELSRRFGLPIHHVDQLSWQPGFIHRTADELNALTRNIHQTQHWILEGGHYETLPERAQRAQLLLWVDPGKPTQLARVAWRSWRYHGKIRPGMGEGCQEWFGKRTLEAIVYAGASRDFHREKARDIIATAPSTLTVLHLKTAWQVRKFLKNCQVSENEPGFTFS